MLLSLYTAPTVEPITIAEARRQLLLGTSAGEPAPTAPTVALASPAVAGLCDAGAWRLGVTFVTADGETELGDLSAAVTVADASINGKIIATEIAIGGAAVTARKVYALAPGETTAKYAGTIADNTTANYTLNIAKASLGVVAPSTNTTEDPEIRTWITAARERGEGVTRRAFITQTRELWLRQPPCERFIELPAPPLQTVTHVKYYDTDGTLQTMDVADYRLVAPAGPRCRRGRIELAEGVYWPSTQSDRADAVQVRFVCGYGAAGSAVPAMLRSAMKIDLATLYEQRQNVIVGTISSELPGGVREMYLGFRSMPTQWLDGGQA